jgi:hypothetical protein
MAGVELRCDKRLHGILKDDGVIEISCRSALCGHVDGVVVIHRFDAESGLLIGTNRYKDPSSIKKKETSNALGHSTAVRHS